MVQTQDARRNFARYHDKWKGNTLMILVSDTQMYRHPGGQLPFRFKAGDELVYKGCVTVDGVFGRLFEFDDQLWFKEDPGNWLISDFKEPSWWVAKMEAFLQNR